MLAAGHAENALPQSAQATVNCRILPDQAPADVEATLRRVVADDRIAIRTTYAPIPSPPSPLTPAIMGPIERLVAEQFPGVPVVPVMEAGATDGDRKSTRLNSSHLVISYAVFCLKKKKNKKMIFLTLPLLPMTAA